MDINYHICEILKNHKNCKRVFVSLGHPSMKAVVKNFNYDHVDRNVQKFIDTYRKKSGKQPTWIKIDVVTSIESLPYEKLKNDLIQTRRNYVQYGFSLHENWKLAFLPEEINANAFIRPTNKENLFILSEKNITHYIRRYKDLFMVYLHKDYENKQVYKFYTESYLIEGNEVIKLESEGYRKGLRFIEDLSSEIDSMIETSTEFLKNQIQDSGQYIYGYFPHFDKEIDFYNNLRHSSSTYALIEGLTYLNKDVSIIRKPIDYLIKNYLYEVDDFAHIYDDTNGVNEIKLGQNATFILAICEYLKYAPDDQSYLAAAQKVAKGILQMIDKDAHTVHILNYPDLTVKEKFKIVYYDGEAALALLRLYQLDHNEQWLNTVKMLFETFIQEQYWKYHDHWLGYCTNELVQIDPQEKYYKFGIQNVSSYLDYIQQRETTYPTFLEMLMATYHLVEKAKKTGYSELVKENLDEEKFIKTIHIRADYERTGYFYPEIAMYFKNPAKILNSFFIKHHGYRVRIDDIEHYLSGYVQYQKVFK
ncbi:poly(glycerol-phosphate) alpha-glucosyltransferase [Mammaliicoccus vitulinus]|uniref:poly(glycerol-phosphate) alpha-glucosyltransferase n=1 Tax=Mammaliicoccus vitulinus TaxID=71237 RepID=UPI00145C0064|nr:poly(glycerol-phosphate) alpha-glucosyltransferase [Mammaliicoccus vitulinus]QJF25115.1 poly(glycerol-phosphate) alpha-glucosyltransferase [Mammaliicoccus vitulinus]